MLYYDFIVFVAFCICMQVDIFYLSIKSVPSFLECLATQGVCAIKAIKAYVRFESVPHERC